MTPAQSWLENLRSKIQELRRHIDTTHQLSLHSGGDRKAEFELATRQLISNLEAFFHLYGPKTTPDLIKEARQTIGRWTVNPENPAYARGVFKVYEKLDSLLEFDEEPTFEELFRSYKDEGRLKELLDELVNLLKQLLQEGGSVLTADMARELEAILAEIQQKREKSLIDLSLWVEFSFQSLAAVADHLYGTPICAIAVQAGLAAFKTREHLSALVQRVKDKMLDRPELKKLVGKPAVDTLLKPNASEVEVRALLERSTPEIGEHPGPTEGKVDTAVKETDTNFDSK